MKSAPTDTTAPPAGADTAREPPGESVNQPSGPTSKEREEPTAHRGDDRMLVERVQDGDEEAFRQLFERYHRRAFAVALGVVKNQQDAMDIVQDAFVKVHRHIENFQGSSSFYTWLYRIVMNLAIDHVRRRKHARDVEYDDAVDREGQAAGDGALLPRMGDGSPTKNVLRRELTGAIQAALDELPDHHRAVIVLREVEGLSYEEMADVLEVPKGTIMSRLFHARRKMQASLAAYLEGDIRIDD